MTSPRRRWTRERDLPGVLPIVRALVAGDRQLDVAGTRLPVADLALDAGLGAALAYVTADSPAAKASPRAEAIHAAHLVSRLLTAEMLHATEEVLARAHDARCRPLLLKGMSTAMRYYPEPHLRTMGDVDVLVPPAEQAPFESVLRSLGYEQPTGRASLYEGHHHSTPFRHPERGVCFEVHTRLYPPTSPLADDTRVSSALSRSPSSIALGAEHALVMDDESQLIYTTTRWAEVLRARRGIFALVDAALMLKCCDRTLDWDRICASVEGSWAQSALHLLLTYLDRWRLASPPSGVLGRLAQTEGAGGRMSLAARHRLITKFIVQHHASTRILTPRNLQTTWGTLLQPGSPWANLAAVPFRIAFPPDATDRFDLGRAVKRLMTFLRPR